MEERTTAVSDAIVWLRKTSRCSYVRQWIHRRYLAHKKALDVCIFGIVNETGEAPDEAMLRIPYLLCEGFKTALIVYALFYYTILKQEDLSVHVDWCYEQTAALGKTKQYCFSFLSELFCHDVLKEVDWRFLAAFWPWINVRYHSDYYWKANGINSRAVELYTKWSCRCLISYFRYFDIPKLARSYEERIHRYRRQIKNFVIRA